MAKKDGAKGKQTKPELAEIARANLAKARDAPAEAAKAKKARADVAKANLEKARRASKGKPSRKRTQMEIVTLIRKKVEARLRKDAKASLGDYIRLVQLQKELEDKEPGEIRVRWVESEKEFDG